MSDKKIVDLTDEEVEEKMELNAEWNAIEKSSTELINNLVEKIIKKGKAIEQKDSEWWERIREKYDLTDEEGMRVDFANKAIYKYNEENE